MKDTYLITGASGFIGSALLEALIRRGKSVKALSRRECQVNERRCCDSVNWVNWEGCDASALERALAPVKVVIHLAGRAHRREKPTANSTEEFRKANVQYTEQLGWAAGKAGIQRFVYVSSIAVYGAMLGSGKPIDESTSIRPIDSYGLTKLEAEECLREVALQTGMELVIVRPALVVGKGAPGNLARLANLVRRGMPIPVPSQDNRRSFVTLNNLTSLLISCAQNDAAAGEVFVAAEQNQPSTRTVLEWIGEGMGRHVRTVSLPGGLLRTGLSVVGKAGLYDKVFGDLRVDAAKARQLLGWEQAETLSDAFRQLGSSYTG